MRHDRYFSFRLASARLGWRLSHFAIVHWCHSCYPQRRYHPLPSLAIVWLCCVKYTITCCWKKSEVSALFLVLPKASSRVFVIFFFCGIPSNLALENDNAVSPHYTLYIMHHGFPLCPQNAMVGAIFHHGRLCCTFHRQNGVRRHHFSAIFLIGSLDVLSADSLLNVDLSLFFERSILRLFLRIPLVLFGVSPMNGWGRFGFLTWFLVQILRGLALFG